MTKDKSSNAVLRHLKSYRYAWRGLSEIFLGEVNFKILLFFSIIVLVVAFIVELNSVEWIIVAFTLTFLLVSEAFNKSIETACDAICVDYCDDIRFAKDVAAGAVLLVAILAIIVITIIFWPYFSVVFNSAL